MKKVIDSGGLQGLQLATYIYGFIETVLWVTLIGGAAIYANSGLSDTVFGGLVSVTMGAIIFAVGLVHIIFSIILIIGVKRHKSKVVLAYFIFGVMSNAARLVLLGYYMIADNFSMVFEICVLFCNVLYGLVLWMVFICYRQIKFEYH